MTLLATWQNKQAIILVLWIDWHVLLVLLGSVFRRPIEQFHLEEDQSVLSQLRKNAHTVADFIDTQILLESLVGETIAEQTKS